MKKNIDFKKRINDIKKNINILYIAYKKYTIPWYSKVTIGLVVAYAFSLIDLIPDFIPILGYLDDMILLPLGILLAIRLIPKNVYEKAKSDVENKAINTKHKSYVGGVMIALFWIIINDNFC